MAISVAALMNAAITPARWYPKVLEWSAGRDWKWTAVKLSSRARKSETLCPDSDSNASECARSPATNVSTTYARVATIEMRSTNVVRFAPLPACGACTCISIV